MWLFDRNINRFNRRVFGSFLGKLPLWITPNIITFFGFFLSLLIILFFGFYRREIALAVFWSLPVIVFDVLDGVLARQRGVANRYFGKVLDALVDNSISIFLLGLLYNFEYVSLSLFLILSILLIIKSIMQLLDYDYELGGGRIGITIAFGIKFAFLDSNIDSVDWFSFERIMLLFIVWNSVSVLNGIINSVVKGKRDYIKDL